MPSPAGRSQPSRTISIAERTTIPCALGEDGGSRPRAAATWKPVGLGGQELAASALSQLVASRPDVRLRRLTAYADRRCERYRSAD